MTDASLNASFWIMIFLQTLGSVDPMPGMGPRKMPAPKAYVVVVIAWGVLQVVADMGFRRGAAKMGWLMVLAGMVLGPFGKRVIHLINWVAQVYGGITPSGQPAQGSGQSQAPDNATAGSTY